MSYPQPDSLMGVPIIWTDDLQAPAGDIVLGTVRDYISPVPLSQLLYDLALLAHEYAISPGQVRAVLDGWEEAKLC